LLPCHAALPSDCPCIACPPLPEAAIASAAVQLECGFLPYGVVARTRTKRPPLPSRRRRLRHCATVASRVWHRAGHLPLDHPRTLLALNFAPRRIAWCCCVADRLPQRITEEFSRTFLLLCLLTDDLINTTCAVAFSVGARFCWQARVLPRSMLVDTPESCGVYWLRVPADTATLVPSRCVGFAVSLAWCHFAV